MDAFTVSTVACLTVFLSTLVPRWKAGEKKIFWIGICFLVCGYAFLSVVSFGIRPPSPLLFFEWVVSLFTGAEPNWRG